MFELKLKPEAQIDLEKIYEYTAMNWGIEQADQYQDELYPGMLLIAGQENLGNEYPYANIPYRKFHVNRHLIFYRLEGKNCVIVRILHDSMEIERHMGKED